MVSGQGGDGEGMVREHGGDDGDTSMSTLIETNISTAYYLKYRSKSLKPCALYSNIHITCFEHVAAAVDITTPFIASPTSAKDGATKVILPYILILSSKPKTINSVPRTPHSEPSKP
jgi:hypothetical protein